MSKPWAVDGRNFSDRIWTYKTDMVNTLHKQLTKNCSQGLAPDKAIKEMAKFVDKKLGNSEYCAGRLVMTELAYISSVAQKDSFNELGVEEFEVVATLDSKTSQLCKDMDSNHYPMEEYEVGVTAPPFHPWCRSCTAPYYDDEFTSNDTRIARGEDGETYKIPADMSYRDWEQTFVKDELTIDNDSGIISNKNIEEIFNQININSVEEAKKVLKDDIGFKTVVNSVDLDEKLLIINTKQLKVLEDKFGVIHNSVDCGISNGEIQGIAQVNYTTTQPNAQRLTLSTGYYNNLDTLKNEIVNGVTNNDFMPIDLNNGIDSLIYAITHEYGHMLQNIIIYKTAPLNTSFSKDYCDFIAEEHMDEIYKIAEQFVEFNITDNLSEYSIRTAHEFFAEVFTNSQLSTPNILGKALMIWLKEKGMI